MSFEVCYTGDATVFKVFASTPSTKGIEFFDKMDALMKEGEKISQDSLDIREREICELVREVGNKAIAEKYPDGKYEIGWIDPDEIIDNSIDEKFEAKEEKMRELCREYFEDGEAKTEGNDFDYEGFNDSGTISVDDEDLDMGSDWTDAFEDHENEPGRKQMELQEQNWCVIYTIQSKSVWKAVIEEDEFDKEKLNWKDGVVHYGDTPINEDIAGARPIAEEIYLMYKFGEKEKLNCVEFE